MGVALYFIDKLALRAGHEKDDDEADTVGCCNLKARLAPACARPALPARRPHCGLPARMLRRRAAWSGDAHTERRLSRAAAALAGAAGRRAGRGHGVACRAELVTLARRAAGGERGVPAGQPH